ncbi:MAG: hypothetical protein DCC67_10110 [Planctomycetota bacterium]|nr:MAG: hypothetical protein DCC67_10110 [Planctomycetota bacterium]
MKRVLLVRSFLDSWLLLAGCAALAAAFTCLRVWVSSHIEIGAFIRFFSENLKMLSGLLPAPIEDLATPLGRVAFSFEEFGLVLLLGLWSIARGSDCLAGRIGDGTMEMLLAQPVGRLAVLSTHTAVTLLGVIAIAGAAWCGIGAGLHFSKFAEPPPLGAVTPGILNFLGLGVFVTGAATLVSALCRARATAVGLVIGFYVIEIAVMVVSRMVAGLDWMKWVTILSAYEPTMLTLAIDRDPAENWPILWQYNGLLLGLGSLLWAIAARVFCRRDVPAPL